MKTKQTNIRLTDEQRTFLTDKGFGDLSAGLKSILSEQMGEDRSYLYWIKSSTSGNTRVIKDSSDLLEILDRNPGIDFTVSKRGYGKIS